MKTMRAQRLQQCRTCVMDTSDSRIVFDSDGVCDHCRGFHAQVESAWRRDEAGQGLQRLAAEIRAAGSGRDFDCILGLSGGLDSSYLLHVAVTVMGLRPLVFHVDGGWNTEVAVANIERLVGELDVDLFTEVVDWEEMRDLQIAYFKSGVPHLDIPQDHAFIATLYNFAESHKVRYILNGGNIATECVQNPLDWIYYGTDMRQFWDIHRRFGERQLERFPISGILRHKAYLRYVRRISVVKPLNLTRYRMRDAIAELNDRYGWEWYGRKHFESRFTRFYEGYWLPERFGFDTRKVQLSSLILTGQISRDEALSTLESSPFDVGEIREDRRFIASKLRVSDEELQAFFDLPLRSYRDYRNSLVLMNRGAQALKFLGIERTIKR